MAKDLPPVPIQAPITDNSGIVPLVWTEWFRLLSGESSKASPGYQKLPGGLIIQWGAISSTSAGADAVITFPVAFPTAVLVTFPATDGTAATTDFKRNGSTVTTATFRNSSGSNSQTGAWFAIGH